MLAAEERLRVLRMIQNGQITASEGARLLEALREQERTSAEEERQLTSQKQHIRLFHIRVTDLKTGRQKIDMRIPWSLVNVGVNMGARFAHKEIKMEEFIGAVQSGATGKIMNLVDEDEGEVIEIFVE
jgi:DUF4097 and DUF4098 domain-containing protein YvlB